MKFKTTAKAIRNNGGRILSIGYCDMQHLLHYESPVAYTSGVYGWNFDVYYIGSYTICTGYRNMPGKSVSYELIKYFEEKAEKIVYNWKYPGGYDAQKAEVEKLLAAFLDAAWNDISISEYLETEEAESLKDAEESKIA